MIKVTRVHWVGDPPNHFEWFCDYCVKLARDMFLPQELTIDEYHTKDIHACPSCGRINYDPTEV